MSRKNLFLTGLLVLFSTNLMAKDPISWTLNHPFPNTVFTYGDYNVQYTLRNELPFTLINPLIITKNSSSAAEFSFIDQCTGKKLLSGETCLIRIILKPKVVGIKTASVIIGGYDKNQVPLPTLTTSAIIDTTAQYTVGGSTFGLDNTQGDLVLLNNGDDEITMSADGEFTFSNPLPTGSTYSVTVKSGPANQTCSVNSDTGEGTINNANVTNVKVICSVNSFHVGGTLSGLAPQKTVQLQLDGTNGEIKELSVNAPYVFNTKIAQGAIYAVELISVPNTQTCDVENHSGIMGVNDVTNVNVKCSTITYSLGGTLTGLAAGKTVVLDDGFGHTISLTANAPFTFPERIAAGAVYNVAVIQNPSHQQCKVTNKTGTMTGNVNDVSVNCTNNSTSLTVTPSALVLSVAGKTEIGVPGTPLSGKPRIITITNMSSTPALNLSISALGVASDTTSSTTCTPTLAGLASCTITINPGLIPTSNCNLFGTAPLPVNITISADNADPVTTSAVVLDYGCIYQSGYIFALDDTPPNTTSISGKVVSTDDQVPQIQGVYWSANSSGDYDDGVPIYAIAESSVPGTPVPSTPQPGVTQQQCAGKSDGSCNTNNIFVYYQSLSINPSFYAAGVCKASFAGHSDWYLPTSCELSYGNTVPVIASCGNSTTPALQNIQSSLWDYKHLNKPSGLYVSSTEYSGQPDQGIYACNFSPGADGSLFPRFKGSKSAVRCTRIFNPYP